MTILRMDHVGAIVDDLEAATAFFLGLGVAREGEASSADPSGAEA